MTDSNVPQRTPEQDQMVAALAEPDTDNTVEIDVIEAVQMLIKSAVNIAQRMALLELAMGNCQQQMTSLLKAMEDDGK